MASAVRIHKTGGPEVLTFEEIQLKDPGQGEVRIKHTAIGLNFIDTYFRSGLYPAPGGLPMILGNEGAGVVTAVGGGVTNVKVGDRVAYCTAPGGYSTERNIPADKLVKLSDKVDDKTAAAMMLKGLTAQYLIRQTFKVGKGHTVLVHAAAGGVGQILVQWCKHLGATVIGTAGSPDKMKLAKDLGADHMINYREEDWVAKVGEASKGAKCDVAYDGVGKATFPGSLDCLKPRGMFASFGNASGSIEAFNIGLLQQKGSLFATRPTLLHYANNAENLNAMAKDLMDVVGSGAVKVPVQRTFALKDAATAHTELEGRKTTGSSVLLP